MKDLKKLFFTVSIFVIFNIPAFAKSGFEFILNVPIGASYSIISQNMKDYEMKNYFGFDVGVNTQLGYMFQIKDSFGISILGDIGYSHDSYKIKCERDYLQDYNFIYDSIQIGLLPKINIKGFSIGIGFGIKFPIYYEDSDYYAEVEDSYSTQNNENFTGEENEQWVDYVYMYGEGMVSIPYPFIPYVKLALDYSIFFTNKWAVNIGLYCRYDFLPEQNIFYYYSYNNYGNVHIKKPKNYGPFNFGIQLGFRFGPRA